MQPHSLPLAARRPLKARSTPLARRAAARLTAAGITPNAVSLAGVVAAAGGAWAMHCAASQPLAWLAAAAAIQLRLAANLLDGMVAVEGGRASPTGPLFNEVPDRLEDSLLLIAAASAGGVAQLGWLAALLACGTAYVRALGGALGCGQDFCGPQAKQQRMAVLTLAALAAAVWPAGRVMPVAMAVIAAGTALTLGRRLARLAARLQGRAA